MAGGREQLAVGTECDTVHRALMLEAHQLLAGTTIPDACGLVIDTNGSKPRAIGAEGNIQYRAFMPHSPNFPPSTGIPNAYTLVGASGCNVLPFGTECHLNKTAVSCGVDGAPKRW